MKLKISTRQNKILKAIVREHIVTALPVSSEKLVKKYRLNFSSATVRNEMTALEKKGLIAQPHTSSGRVPTDQGYRYFVDYLMPDQGLSLGEQKKLTFELLKTKAAHNKLLRRMTKLLSRLTGGMALTSVLDDDLVFDYGLSSILKEPEFNERKSVSEVAQMVDFLDEHIIDLAREVERNPKVYIGAENPLCDSPDCTLLVSRFQLPSGEKGIVALLGPKRMHYSRNMSILNHLTKVLGGTAASSMFLVNCSKYILDLLT